MTPFEKIVFDFLPVARAARDKYGVEVDVALMHQACRCIELGARRHIVEELYTEWVKVKARGE